MRRYYLNCDSCGHKSIVDENPQKFGEKYYQYDGAQCQARIPYLDPDTQKTVVSSPIPLMPKFRCPGCGRAITAKKVYMPPKKDEKREDKTDGCETGAARPQVYGKASRGISAGTEEV